VCVCGVVCGVCVCVVCVCVFTACLSTLPVAKIIQHRR